MIVPLTGAPPVVTSITFHRESVLLGFFLDFCFVKRSFWGALGVTWESSQQRSARTNWTFGQFLFGTRLGPPKRCLVPSISKIYQAVLQVLRQTSPNALDTPDITADPNNAARTA